MAEIAESTVRSRALRWYPPGILLALGLFMTAWTWGTWPHPYVDFGRELYVPWQITEGKVLFRDLAYFNGPLSPYVNAAVFALFGVGLRTLAIFNLVVVAGVCFVLHRLLDGMSDRLTATVGCALYLFLFCFGQIDSVANFNWVCPYSHEMTHGVALAITVAFAMTRWSRGGSRFWLAAGGLGTGLVFLTKPETFAGCALAASVGLVVAWLADGTAPSRVGRDLATFLGVAAVPPVAAFAALLTAMPAAEALRGTLGGWLHVLDPEISRMPFYAVGMGLDDVGSRLRTIASWSAIWAAVVGLPVAVSALLRKPGAYRPVVALAVAAAILLAGLREGTSWQHAFTPLTPAVAAIAVARCAAWWRAGTDAIRRRAGESLVLVALAAGLLPKMVLNARVFHYGFGLGVPATMLCVVALFHWIPRWVEGRGGYGSGVRIAGLAAVLLVAVGYGGKFAYWVDRRSRVLGSGADAFRVDRLAPPWEKLIGVLRGLPEGATLAVMPEGIMFNYLARRPNPTPYVTLLPPEFRIFGEDRMLEAFESNPPDRIVLLTRLTPEYGVPVFGTHYGRDLFAWVRREYVPIPEEKIGPHPLHPDRLRDGRWGIWILERAPR